MKAVIAIDSFKGSLTSTEAGAAVAEGIKRVYTDAETVIKPLADGGEGTVEALVVGMGAELNTVVVSDPLGRPIKASYGIMPSSKTAVIEMSSAAGITLINENERNPLHTTTYGVGELIKDAVNKGVLNFIIGIGGSATNDGGIGMLQALGFGILNNRGRQVGLGAKGLENIAKITDDGVLPRLKDCSFKIACDVVNPLCGKNGCSAVYGPQKGADPVMTEKMDKWLKGFGDKVRLVNPKADPDFPGAGAAGGLGFAFMSFLNGELLPGADIIIRQTELEDCIKTADVVITGEGRLDLQTAMGKAPIRVAELAKKYNKPVIAFAGSVTKDATMCLSFGIDAFFPVLREVCELEDAMKNAASNLTDTAEQAFRLIKTFE